MLRIPARLAASLSFLAAVLFPVPPDAGANPKAEAAFRALSDRFNQPGGDRAALARDLLAFRRAHAGTPQAVQAAALLVKLPSVLDQMDPAKIRSLEKFDWQPKELVGVLGEHLGRHGAAVSCVAYSPDGTKVASGGSAYVRLWDPATMRLQHLLGGGSITALAFSRDNQLLAAANGGGGVSVWDLTLREGPRLRCTISASTVAVPGVAFGPENKLALACSDNQLRIYDVSGAEAKDLATINAHAKGLGAVAWSPDGKILATGSDDATVKLWSLTPNGLKETLQFSAHAREVTALTFNAAGTALASGGADGAIHLWPMPAATRPKARLAIAAPNTGAVHALSFSNTGQTLAAAYADHTARLWTVSGTRPAERARLEGHAGPVRGVCYAPDNKTLVTGSSDWTVRSWDLTAPKPAQRQEPWSHLSHVYSVAFSPDCLTLASGSEDRVLRLWDMARAEPRTRSFLKGDSIPLYAVTFSPDGRFVAAGGNGTQVRQWEAATGRSLRPCPSPGGPVYTVAYGPDGKQLFFQTPGHLFVYDADKAVEKMRISGHETRIHKAAFSPDGRFGLSCSGEYLYKDGKLVYDKGQPVYTECLLKYWELESGRELFCDRSHTVPVYGAAFSADGKQVLSGAYEPKVRRWDAADGKLIEATGLKGSAGYSHGLTVSPDNTRAVTLGLDGKLILWDLATGTRRKEWVFPETIGGVAFAPDGRHLAVSLGTGVIYILRLS